VTASFSCVTIIVHQFTLLWLRQSDRLTAT
jgi:hypothetical protein